MSKHKQDHQAAVTAPATNPLTKPVPTADRPVSGRPGNVTITLDRQSAPLLVVGGLIALAMLAWAMGWLPLPAAPAVGANANLWLIFITGLTTGGLSCLAVQGGLLATTIAQREQALLEREARVWDHALPVVVFLLAKLAAYTILGAALGYVGSFISLSSMARGVLQVAVGVFMLIVAAQLLDIHPFFRRFSFQPPKAVQRAVRRQSRRGDALGPAILGALTVLIPCGVTQAMMLVAMGTGSAARGALVMFAFVLGTMPVFFLLGLAATRISAVWQQGFRYVAVAVVVVLALVAIISGVRLLGVVPTVATTAPAATAVAAGPVAAPAGVQEPVIQVLPTGYSPDRLEIKAGIATRLKLVTDNVHSCALAFTIPSLAILRVLPPTGEEYIDIPPQQPGQIAFVCSMGMYGGVIEVVP